MTKIILDTDLGMGEAGTEIDDGFALALAHSEPSIDIELITTVAGNTDVETVTTLTKALSHRLGINVPIIQGASRALLSTSHLPGMVKTEAKNALSSEIPSSWASVEIVRHCMLYPGEVTIVAIGPLTNIALALCLEPRLATHVHEIVIMGGMFFGQTHYTGMPGEFNVWSDPEAAQIVLNSGARMRWVGLDVTQQVRITREQAHQLSQGTGNFAPFASEYTLAWIDAMARMHPDNLRGNDSCAMHDPLAVAAIAMPHLLTWKPAALSVVTGESVAKGHTVTDLLMASNSPQPNCLVADSVNVEGFTQYFLERISAL